MIEIEEKEFMLLTTHIKENYGIDLTRKKALIEGRLNTVLIKQGFDSYEKYLKYAFNDPTKEEFKKIICKLTTNHTYFMREFSHFKFFQEKVLPVLAKTVTQRDLRIWSAGCSSGAEPYTLAMILDEYFTDKKSLWDTKILATDISVDVLEKAKMGRYSDEELEEVPKIWQMNYFDKIDDSTYEVKKKIKDEVIFRIFNLMEEKFPFSKKFHVIFCRNVMIYFDYDTRTKLVNKFYEQLENGGYLFIGHSESISGCGTKFKYVLPSVYQKRIDE